MNNTPKIFISYSWTTPTHESWVINLAERLVSDGIDVTIDKWDLKEGHDKFKFMETMVKSSDIDKVLIILDKLYTEKANDRKGGVGTETQIISPNIYSNISQEKFVPVVSELDEDGKAFVPIFLEGRIYIDLSNQVHFEQNYESLLRNIYKRPAYRKPKLGKAPSYLFEENPSNNKTSSILRSFDNHLEKNPKRINSLTRDFLDGFYNSLKDYSIEFNSRDIKEFGKKICENINSYTPLRNEFIAFMEKATKNDLEFKLDIEIVIKFIEKLPLLNHPQDNNSSGSPSEFDNFRFFSHEIFLYLVAIGLRNENYEFIEEILYSNYFFNDKYNYDKEPKTYKKLYHHLDIIKQYYNETYSKNYYSPMAELMIKRIPDNMTSDSLIDADLLCHYVSVLENHYWFPLTYIYRTRGRYELFDRLVSLRHFERVKRLFGISTVDELKRKLLDIQQNDKNPERMAYPGSFDSVIPIYRAINIEKIGTMR